MSRQAVARVEAALEAAHADTTNSFTQLDDAALDRAEKLEAGKEASGLWGTPIAVKDIIDHAGRTTTAGSAFYRFEADTTAPALARLEAAGAVVIGRTGLHEFAFGFSSENPWFGPVLNPWDHSLSPGGSSGGSAAAVAAGIVPVAVGTDTGGSVRVPAALCAVTGLKVTHGRIPLDGVFPLVPSLDTVGAIAADLDHLELATRLMAGATPWEVTESTGSLRLVVPEQWVETAATTPEVKAGFDHFLTAATDAGFPVERQELPELGPSPLQARIIGPEVAAIHRVWREQALPYGDDVAERIDAALAVATDDLADAQEWRSNLTAAMAAATAGPTVLVTPAVAAMDKRIGEDMIGDHHYRTLLSWFTAPVNTAGLPALTMPLAGPGRQPSVQFIGARWTEPNLLALARLLAERGVLGVGLETGR